ncbi:MAG: DUF3987 domain-containing protein [Phycisphaerales bacterium]
MRTADPPAGWRKIKTCPDGGTVFRLADEPRREVSVRRTEAKPTNTHPGRPFPTLDSAIAAAGRKLGGEHTGTWTYKRGDGRTTLYVARFNLPDGGKQFRPLHHNGTGYVMGDPPDDDGPLPLYRLADLSGQPRVFIVEGENCADAAASIGLAATTSAHGSKSAAKTNWQPLAGREVVILPDADEAGQHYAETVASILHRLQPPAMVRILDLPDLPLGGDICEFIQDRRTDAKDDRAIRTEIEDLAALIDPEDPQCAAHGFQPYHPFPVDALPKPVADMVLAVSRMVGCDPVFAALPAMTMLAGLIGTTRKLMIQRGHYACAVLWAAIIARSGTAKSPAADPIFTALAALQRRRMREYEKAIEDYQRDMMAFRADVKRYESARRKGATVEPPTEPKRPVQIRYLVRDTTLEALCALLADNPRGLILHADELSAWLGAFDRYSGGRGGADRAHWLSIYDAREVIVDRKSAEHRKPIYAPAAAVSVYGTIQPGIASRLLDRDDRDSGLVARLLLVCPPSRALRWTGHDLPETVDQQWADLAEQLLTLEHDVDTDGEPTPRLVRLTASARQLYASFYDEQADRWEQADSDDLAAAISKLRAVAARFALVIHLTRWAAGEQVDPGTVDADSMRRAITLARWHTCEAERVYTMLGESEEDRDRRRLVELIERRGGSVTVRDWQRARSHQTSADAEAELKTLESGGYGTLRPAPQTGRGRPSKVFTLHPDVADTDNNPVGAVESGISSVSEASGGPPGRVSGS